MRRRVLAIILSIGMTVALLTGLPSFAQAVSDGDSSIVRVKLSIGSVTSFTFYTDGNYSVGGNALQRDQYNVKVESGKVGLYLGSTRIALDTSIHLTQHAATSGCNNMIWLNNATYGYCGYLGDMRISVSSGNLLLVNYIDADQYLYGVLPYEMSDSWPAEALKAQAVAARNYAVKRMGSGGSYDITDLSSSDQVYRGYDATKVNSIAAVNATAGQVLKSGSTIIDCYYSASNGGWTELPYHRWGGGADWTYYRIDYDPYDIANPSSRFETITFPVAIDGDHPVTTSTNLSGTIDAGKAIDVIRQAIVDSGQLSGVTRISDFTLTGVTDLFTHTYDTSSGQDHSRMPWNGVNDCVDKVKATGNFSVSVGGTPAAVTSVTFDMRDLCSSSGGTAFFYASLGAYIVEPVMQGETVIAYNLSMRRYGHGIGLSQRGAQQRANSGDESARYYNQILEFYYPGTTLTTLSLARPALTSKAAPDYSNATVTGTSALNVRSSASTSSDANIIGSVPIGARLEVTDDYYTSSWHQIRFAGGTAYVWASYTTLDSPFGSRHVSGVTLDITTASITFADTLTLTATVAPSNAANPAVTWASGNTAVATVSNGVVSPVGEGTANITVTTAEGGYTATCAVAVKSDGITSTTYRIGINTVSGVLKNTTVAQLKAGLSNDPANLHVYKADGAELTEGVVGTGMTVALIEAGAEKDRLTIVVMGDVNGDGNISISDYTLIRYQILDLKPLIGGYLAAGDVNGDGSVSISDYTLIRYDILGLKTIS
jgi:peptidoglycan hydrolase-like amidase